MGEATVPETFPFTVSISDLKDFLQAIARFREPLFTFGPDHVLITESDQTADLSYPYAKRGSISLLPMKRKDNQAILAEKIEITITEAQWADIWKSLGDGNKHDREHQRLKIVSDGTDVVISPTVVGESEAEYSVSVAATAHGHVCNMVFAAELLPALPGSYEVSVTPHYTEFVRAGGCRLLYLLAADPNDSVWGGQTLWMYCMREKQKKYQEVQASVRELNKAAVFDALATSHVTSVIVDFDGSGDEGQINNLMPYAGESEAELPNTLLTVRAVELNGNIVKTQETTLKDAIEQLCYDLLGQEHGGWEINDGSYGEFCFDVESRTIALEFNGRFTDTWTDNHTF